MNIAKVAGWAITILFFLFLFWLAGLILNIGFGILSVIGSLLSALIGLVFSKAGLTLLAVGLILYILCNRGPERRYRRHGDCRW